MAFPDPDRPRPARGPIRPRPGPIQAKNLLRLLSLYQQDPTRLSRRQSDEIQAHLARLREELNEEQELTFREARAVDQDTLCLVFEGEPSGLWRLGYRASLLIDFDWNLSGGIVFDGLRVTPVRLN